MSIPEELETLAFNMHRTATNMEYYAGLNEEITAHAKELHGSADIAQGWADGIREDEK